MGTWPIINGPRATDLRSNPRLRTRSSRQLFPVAERTLLRVNDGGSRDLENDAHDHLRRSSSGDLGFETGVIPT